MEKICKVHGLVKHFHSKSDSRDRCGTCAMEAVKRRRVKVKELAVEYKGGKCEHCKIVYHPAVLEFHHRDPGNKDFAIGGQSACKAWAKVKAELDKCDMLCANCHRLEHVRLGDSY